jgi:hypothetical protein
VPAREEAAVEVMMGVAGGNTNESELASWLEENCVPR